MTGIVQSFKTRLKRRLKELAGRAARFLVREACDERMLLRARDEAGKVSRKPLYPVPAETPIKVAFLMEIAEAWGSFESVWKAFCEDASCETTVVAVTPVREHNQGKTSPREFLLGRDIPFVASEYYDVAHARPDVVFFQRPYEWMRPAHLRLEHVRAHVARTVYIPYGFEIGGGSKRCLSQFNHPLQREAWRVFVRSERFKRLYRKKCDAGDAHVTVAGHPMVDAVLARTRSSADSQLRDFVGSRKSIIWNPHYNESRDQSDFSTFLRWKDLMLDLFAARPDMVLILRPHPILFKHLASQGLMSVEEIDLFQRRFVGSPNMIMDERADFTHAFAVSDALISDASSFLTLYGAIGKPIQYLPNPTGPGLNEEGEIVDAYYKGDSAEAIGRFVEMIGDGEDPLRERRQAVFDQFVYRPQEGAGVFIKKYIINAVRRGI